MKHWQLQSRGDFELDICLLGYNLKAERSLWGFMKYISSENYNLEVGELYLVEEKELVCLKSWLFSLGSSHFVFMTTVWYWYSCKVWFTVVGTEAWWQFEPMTPWHQLLYLCPHPHISLKFLVRIQTYVVQYLIVPSFPCSTKIHHSWP